MGGCLLGGLAALLSLAIPATIARASLVGAYVVLALLAAVAYGGLLGRAKQRGTRPPRVVLVRLGVIVAAYALALPVIHFA